MCKPAAPEGLEKFTCEKCEFISAEEIKFKRHIQDNHDINTASTSLRPKRRRKKNITYTEEKMEIDDPEDILIQRSKMWMIKLKRKERSKRNLKKNSKEISVSKKSWKNQKKRIEKRNSKRMSRKNLKRINTKPYLRELPEAVRNTIGGNYSVYPVVGDGSCGLRTIAA